MGATIIHAMMAEREMRMPKEREITRLAKSVSLQVERLSAIRIGVWRLSTIREAVFAWDVIVQKPRMQCVDIGTLFMPL